MLAVLVVFRVGIMISGATMRRTFGVVLIAVYLIVTALSYTQSAAP
jgi:hypothetical protein